MSTFFGGNSGDNGASAVAAANERIAAENRSQQAQLLAQQKADAEKAKAEMAASEKLASDQRQKAINDARSEQEKQQAAQASTGANVSGADAAASQKQMAIAAQTGNNASLPGFNSLASRMQQNKGGFAGQSNALTSNSNTPGFTNQPGGRRYV